MIPYTPQIPDNLLPDRLLTIREVAAITGLSRATIYRQIDVSDFPKPLKLGLISRWSSRELMGFIEALKSALATIDQQPRSGSVQ